MIKESWVSRERAKKTLEHTAAFLQKMQDRIPPSLRPVWDDIVTMYDMLRDAIKGDYRAPWKTISAIVVALTYLVNPFDLIPDFIFVAGWLDDVAVIKKAIDVIRQDLYHYRESKKPRESL